MRARKKRSGKALRRWAAEKGPTPSLPTALVSTPRRLADFPRRGSHDFQTGGALHRCPRLPQLMLKAGSTLSLHTQTPAGSGGTPRRRALQKVREGLSAGGHAGSSPNTTLIPCCAEKAHEGGSRSPATKKLLAPRAAPGMASCPRGNVDSGSEL